MRRMATFTAFSDIGRSLFLGFGKTYRPRPVKCCTFCNKSTPVSGQRNNVRFFPKFHFLCQLHFLRRNKSTDSLKNLLPHSMADRAACKRQRRKYQRRPDNRCPLIFFNPPHQFPGLFPRRQRRKVHFTREPVRRQGFLQGSDFTNCKATAYRNT